MGHRCFKRSVAMKRDESLLHTKADKLFADKEDPTEQSGGGLRAISEPYTYMLFCWFLFFSQPQHTLSQQLLEVEFFLTDLVWI